jgi:hypothetical protein
MVSEAGLLMLMEIVYRKNNVQQLTGWDRDRVQDIHSLFIM